MCLLPLLFHLCMSADATVKVALLSEAPLSPVESPDFLERTLDEIGCDVLRITPKDLADDDKFDRERFDLLVLPFGGYFPVEGREPLLNFLKSGGAFLSFGGYAFDDLRDREGNPVDLSSPQNAHLRINARFGQPGDTMRISTDQIPIFDPSHRLENVSYISRSPEWPSDGEPLRLEGRFSGYSAIAMTGSNSPVFPDNWGRWIPILNAYDRYGELRGTVGALVYNYAGPYRGSAWAFFGVKEPILSLGKDWAYGLLEGIVNALMRRTFLSRLSTNWACYRQGEEVLVSATVSNFGMRPQEAEVTIRLDGDEIARVKRSISPGETEDISAVWRPERFDHDLYKVEALLEVNGALCDRMKTGFVVWDKGKAGKGFDLSFHDNYFHVDGKAKFLCGTNQTGMMWFSPKENPLIWDRDFARMRDNGLRVLRVLHFSPFSEGGYEGRPSNDPMGLRNIPERLVRQADAMVQLAVEHVLILFVTLHDWMPVELSEEELEAQRRWNEFWVRRYSGLPVIFDIQNEPSVHPERTGLSKPEGKRWDDLRAIEYERAKVYLLERWISANVEGIVAGDPDAIFTVGFLPWIYPADKILGTHRLTFSNMHYYGPLERLPAELKLTDRRFEGKSLSLGEFGAQEAHDARVRGEDGRPDLAEISIGRFLTTLHYTFALGGSMTLNWDWKDMDDCIFPWGLTYAQDGVAKPWLNIYRNAALFYGLIEPKYKDPSLYLVIPDGHRLGGRSREITEGILRAIDLILGCHVNFNVINELDLEGLPDSAKALIYPIPYCPGDEAFERILEFVKRGGTLYISGDIAWDDDRRRTKGERFKRLGLDDPGGYPPFDTPEERWLLKPMKAQLDKGAVYFVPYPLELRRDRGNLQVYRDFLDFAGIKGIQIDPDSDRIHALSIPTADGGDVYLLYNWEDRRIEVSLAVEGREYRVKLHPKTPCAMWMGPKGELIGVGVRGELIRDGLRLISTSSHLFAVAIDGEDLVGSKEILIMPSGKGDISFISSASSEQSSLTAVVGEVSNGEWKAIDRIALDRGPGGEFSIQVKGEAVGRLMLVTIKGQRGAIKKIIDTEFGTW
jgi:hypothetical protein